MCGVSVVARLLRDVVGVGADGRDALAEVLLPVRTKLRTHGSRKRRVVLRRRDFGAR